MAAGNAMAIECQKQNLVILPNFQGDLELLDFYLSADECLIIHIDALRL